MYSYGWREYMPDIGRWNGMDQMAESYLSASPYVYVMNNPINMFDPDGRVTMAALTQAMWDQTPEGTNSYWQNSNSGDTDSGGKPGGGGGSFVYIGGTAGLYAGYGIGSTLDMNGNFNSHYGTVTNGVLNYMYWTNGVPASGNSIEGLNAHKGSLNLSASNSSKNLDWYGPAGKGNFGFGTAATTVGFVEGSFRLTNGIYNGNAWSPKYYPSGWAGGSRARITTYNFSKIGSGLGRLSLAIGVVMDIKGMQIYQNDPNSPNAVHPGKAGLNTVMGILGSEGGAYGAIISTLYFGIDNFYPGGWVGASETAARTEAYEQQITGHPFFSNSSMKF